MNIILAQLKKDIQCQRRPLIVWGICAVLAVVVPLVLSGVFSQMPSSIDSKNMGAVMVGAITTVGIVFAFVLIAGFAQFLLLPLMVVRIVQEDALLGTSAFWRTRPIARKELLAAKALLLAVLPLPLLWLGGSGARFGSGHFWLAELAWLSAFAAVASITAGAKDFLIYAVALVFGKTVLGGVLAQVWIHLHGKSVSTTNGMMHPLSVVLDAVSLSGSDFYHLCYFAGLSAVFVHQYLTLKKRKSLVLLVLLIVLVSLLQMPGGLPSGPPETPEP